MVTRQGPTGSWWGPVHGFRVARHLDGAIYEVRVDADRQDFRVLFAPVGRQGQVLLALEAISKKSQKTPRSTIRLARRRLADWGSRAGST